MHALKSFYGLGPATRRELMARFNIHVTAKMGSLGEKRVEELTDALSKLTLENAARRQLVENIRRLRDMNSHRGRCHAMGLPVRGQRTSTNVGAISALETLVEGGD